MSAMGEGPLARFRRVKRPVAREDGLLVEQVADETVVYDDRTKEAHCLSPLAAVVFENCDGDTTIEELVLLASERLGEPVDEPRVIDALVQLQERDLLAVPPRGGLSRREMIGKSAVVAGGVAFAAPLITSMVPPAAIAASSATCANILCCPCCTNSNLDKEECCTTPQTVNCQCVQASQNQRPSFGDGIISGGKFCKTAGQSAPSDTECINTINPPSTWNVTCFPFTVAGQACDLCAS